MRKIDRIIKQYYDLSYTFLIDMLLFSNDLDHDLKQAKEIITTQTFLDCFQKMIASICDNRYYPEETFNNASKILDYIEENSDGLHLDECYSELEKMVFFSNDKYYSEFSLKKNNLEEFKNSNYYVWKKEDIKDSIRFDYSVLISLSTPDTSYLSNYFSSYLLNKNYVYAIKKIIYLCPEIFSIEQFQHRVVEMLMADLKLLDNYDEETLKVFVIRNYHIETSEIDFDLKELESFKKEIQSVLHELNHLNLNPFDFEEFKTYYELLKLEHYLYFDDEINTNSISLDTIYQLIEESSQDSMIYNKNKLIDLLNSKRHFADSIWEYNHYLVMLNELEEMDRLTFISKEFVKRSSHSDYIKGIIDSFVKKDVSLYQKMIESKEYDLGNFEAYIVSDFDFETIKESLKETDYPISIKLFLNECPSMFMDPIVYNRTMEILKSYDD